MATTRNDVRRAAEDSRSYAFLFGGARVEDGEFRSTRADFRRIHAPCDRSSWSKVARQATLDMTTAYGFRSTLP